LEEAVSNKHYDSPEAAEYLGISLSTLYRMERRGAIRPLRTAGGHRRFTKGMLDEFLAKSSKGQLPKAQPVQQTAAPAVVKTARQPKFSPVAPKADTPAQAPAIPRFTIPEPDFSEDEGRGDWEPPQSQHVLDLRRA
jgi:excisionase family DNA binding protein